MLASCHKPCYAIPNQMLRNQGKTMTKAKYVTLCKRTNFPKLGYIIHQLNIQNISCCLDGQSFHAPILKVDESKWNQAFEILLQKWNKTGFPSQNARTKLDDMPDDHNCFNMYANIKPQSYKEN